MSRPCFSSTSAAPEMAACGNQSISLVKSDQMVINGGQFNQNVVNSGSSGFQALANETAPGAFYNAGYDFDLPRCHPNTRVAVLDRIKDWMLGKNCQKASVMWLYGAAGAGKSSIARSMAEWCNDEKILLASFFFSRLDGLRSNFKRFIATITYAITQSVPECRSLIEMVVEKDPHIFSLSLETQILRLIVGPLSQVADRTLPHVIIIDGLDECVREAEQISIVRLLSSTLGKNPSLGWKVLIASRREHAIRNSFADVAMVKTSTQLALSDEYAADDDIRRFLEDRFAEIKNKIPGKSHLPSDWPSKTVIDKLVRKSSGQFIYASTVIKYLSSGKRIKARLRAILDVGSTSTSDPPFAQLDALYSHIIKSAGDGQVEVVTQITAMCSLFPRCDVRSTWPTIYQSPGYTISEVLELDIEDVECILEELSSVVQATENYVTFYHASLGDFLFDSSRAGDLWVDESLLWSKIVCSHFRLLSSTSDHSLSESLIVTSIKGLEKSKPTEQLIQCLISFDSVILLSKVPSKNLLGDSLHLSWTRLLNVLRVRSLDSHAWVTLYCRQVSIYDQWLATIFRDHCSLSSTHKARVAYLSLPTHPRIASVVPSSKTGHNPTTYLDFEPLFSDQTWSKMLKAEQLPKVQACLLDGQTQALAVTHCIHFLVENAVTDRLVRFRGPDRRIYRPWFYRRRLFASRMSLPDLRCLHGKAPRCHMLRSPIIFGTTLSTINQRELRSKRVRDVLESVLKTLPHLLKHASICSSLVFALKVASSLTCASRQFTDLWYEAEKAMERYLVDVAGVKSTRLRFVALSNTWRHRGRRQFGEDPMFTEKYTCSW